MLKAFCVQENEIKLSQYADDTTLILDGSKESFYISFTGFGKFSALYLASDLTARKRRHCGLAPTPTEEKHSAPKEI